MASFIRTLSGAFRRAPRKRYIKNASPGAAVYARHDIVSHLVTVPGGTRGVPLTNIFRDRNTRIVVRWDSYGNGDAIAADLSPHFEVGSAQAAEPPRPPAAPRNRAAEDLRAAARDATTGPRGSAQATRATTPTPGRTRTVTQIVREEPYDPSQPQRPERPLRPGETRRVEIISEEPL
ncbi:MULTISPECIES: hypothetical protein [unclassified Curtobacterium]|uniref:hypothetical protein n=1 Tax=unclassified Curtobacterium TaxID=257496 RepID=UPI0039AF6B7A